MGQAFYQGDLENELLRPVNGKYWFFSDSIANPCKDKIEEICADSVYLHPSGDYTQMTAKSEVLILSQHCCSDMTVIFRTWEVVGNRRNMEVDIPTLHVQIEGEWVLIVVASLSKLARKNYNPTLAFFAMQQRS